MERKFQSSSGVTLLEMLIGIVISSIMMAALYTSYTVVNSSYSQVADRETISRTGRDVVGMLLRDIRMAGYFDVDSIQVAHNELKPVTIGKSSSFKGDMRKCDEIKVVYGDTVYNKGKTPEFTYPIYQITYKCIKSKVPDRSQKKNAAGTFPTKDVFGIYKSKKSWDMNNKAWKDPSSDSDSKTYEDELIIDHVEDLVFNPIDAEGKKITKDFYKRRYDIRSVEILILLRSADDFFKTKKERTAAALGDTNRNKVNKDKYLRESIVVTAHTRNIGMGK